MSGLGPIELVIIVIVVVGLFGPALIAFWLGFTLGRKSGTSETERSAVPSGTERPSATDTTDAPKEPADE